MDQQAGLVPLVRLVLGCEGAVAAALVGRGRARICDKGEFLVQQGEQMRATWLVLDGRIKAESASSAGRSARLALYGPGDWIGSYARPSVSPADIVPLEPGRLLVFASGELPLIAQGEAAIGAALALSFSRQLETTIARLDARSTLTAKGRLCAELLRRAGERLEIVPAPVVAELAHAAQTTRETASRTIAELERRGIVDRQASRLRVASPRLLAELVV